MPVLFSCFLFFIFFLFTFFFWSHFFFLQFFFSLKIYKLSYKWTCKQIDVFTSFVQFIFYLFFFCRHWRKKLSYGRRWMQHTATFIAVPVQGLFDNSPGSSPSESTDKLQGGDPLETANRQPRRCQLEWRTVLEPAAGPRKSVH